MMQNMNRFLPALVALALFSQCVAAEDPSGEAGSRTISTAKDRTTCFVPPAGDGANDEIAPAGTFADQAFGEGAAAGWNGYIRLWRALHADPTSAEIRRYLGLPLRGAANVTPRRGRSAPSWLGWRVGSYQQIETPHFTIYTRAAPQAAQHVAQDLERCYWVWTQMFFPLWEAGAQVQTNLAGLSPDQSVVEYLKRRPARITIRRKLRVVLFRNAAEYRQKLSPIIPGIERSTGFYSDQNQTTFLYPADVDDAATRRHEMVHQLFREATRSGLGRGMPAEQSGFWLIEGIAGYFESLDVGSQLATVGGWDSSRLQFARYRMLVGGDMMPMDELTRDGRVAVQQRPDLARFYAHAIAQTHHLMDGGDTAARRWIYGQLAQAYKIKTDLPAGSLPDQPERRLNQFLRIDDDHLGDNPVRSELTRLCLAGCDVTATGLRKIRPSSSLRWLDLSRLASVDNDIVRALVPEPTSMQQLSLELTAVDRGLNDWLGKATNLQELDLSFTAVDDSLIDAIAGGKEIAVLWLTGSKVSDASIEPIAKMPKLESVDLQRTKVTAAGLARLKKLRPNLSINPLELRSP